MQDKKIDRMITQQTCFNGEKLVDNQDLMIYLKVTDKTLQRYRKKGILPYLMLDGRCYYREGDVHKLIRERAERGF